MLGIRVSKQIIKVGLTGCSTAPAGIMMRRPDPLQGFKGLREDASKCAAFESQSAPAALHRAAARVNHEGDEEVPSDRGRKSVDWKKEMKEGKKGKVK